MNLRKEYDLLKKEMNLLKQKEYKINNEKKRD